MSILPDWKIRHLCQDTDWTVLKPQTKKQLLSPSYIWTASQMLFWKRFVPLPDIPMVFPYDKENVGCSSLDIRIGKTIKKSTPSGWLDIDLSKGQKYRLHQSEFILASSLEVFNLPRWVAASVDLRSSSARFGCQHLKAGHCEPAWNGSVVTLEFVCVNPNAPFEFEMGKRVCQMIFHTMSGEPIVSYAEHGRYNGDLHTQPAKPDERI